MDSKQIGAAYRLAHILEYDEEAITLKEAQELVKQAPEPLRHDLITLLLIEPAITRASNVSNELREWNFRLRARHKAAKGLIRKMSPMLEDYNALLFK